MNSNYKMKAMDIKVYDIEPLDTYIPISETRKSTLHIEGKYFNNAFNT